MRLSAVLFLSCLMGWGADAWAQGQPAYAAPGPMPVDRFADSYAIYSQLLPSATIEWSDVKRTQWLLEDVTTAEPLGEACANDELSNPHKGIVAPANRAAEFADVLADFDARCHDRYLLDGTHIRTSLPLRMMNAEARNRYMGQVSKYLPPANDIMRAPATPDEFKGAAGMHRFRAVYFNKAHTLAMTEFGMYCGGLCGNWTWVVLERTPAGWRPLPWVHSMSFS